MKNIRNTLGIIVLASAIGLAGCSGSKDHSQYKYEGKIGEDQVVFIEKSYWAFGSDDNILIVTKPDGRVIKYVDKFREDLKLEYIEITKDDQTTKYTPDDGVGTPILEKAQKQFDEYLKKIIDYKQKKGLKMLD